jgi:Spy/CpxP family protein refolding chaperone
MMRMGQGGMGMMGGMDMGMMGMGAMGQAPGMAGMSVGSALPGFPGASHLYHVGATGFFLDHDEHIALTDAQKAGLNRVKEQALLEGTAARRQVEEAEQALWTLTAADQPDIRSIEAKVREIAKLRADQRLAFIRSVGEAAKVLTEEQRRQLVGVAPTGQGH